jgi:hypothetical protein
MPKFNPTETPRETLWGAPQTATQLLPGIWEVHTASHGGMILSDERQAAMPAALRLDSTSCLASPPNSPACHPRVSISLCRTLAQA